jgi:hypothetical protein
MYSQAKDFGASANETTAPAEKIEAAVDKKEIPERRTGLEELTNLSVITAESFSRKLGIHQTSCTTHARLMKRRIDNVVAEKLLAIRSNQAQPTSAKTHQFLAKNQCIHPCPENRTSTISSIDLVLTNSKNHWFLRLSCPQAPNRHGTDIISHP